MYLMEACVPHLFQSFYTEGEKERAMCIMKAAFEKHPSRVSLVDINLLLELFILHQKYIDAVQVTVKVCTSLKTKSYHLKVFMKFNIK